MYIREEEILTLNSNILHKEGYSLNAFNIIVGFANIIACIVSVVSLVKISQISKKLDSDNNIQGDNNRNQQVTIGGNNKKKINQRME